MKSLKLSRLALPAVSLLSVALLFSCQKDIRKPFDTGENITAQGYELKQAVVLSRHNIRAPLSGSGSLLERMTTHQWFPWSAGASELSLRGGLLETEMGQYFRKWLEAEGLFPANYHPEEGEVRIYANAKQRTIATAEYFLSGLLPSANMEIEVQAPYDTMDPTFHPQLTFLSKSYVKAAKEQIESLFREKTANLADEYALLSDVLDFKNSEAYRKNEVKDFAVDDYEVTFNLNAEPSMTGSLKTATSASDALTLQYYEEPDETKAAFGHNLSFEQWQSISRIKDTYGDVLFGAPLVAHNVAHPLLVTIEHELSEEERTFSFLCGHDSNLCSVLAAFEVEPYVLPGSIEASTPIGAKVVFSTYVNSQKQEFLRADMVYQNVDFLRQMPLLDLDNHPCVKPLRFRGLNANEDGLYRKEDFMKHLHVHAEKYDEIVATYSE
ncbi:MAG: histidine-type phosphatase [Bacilli bacterium]|nr:histidine-type phosphatase [Bacilli bacterium]